jgi:hypothetical protein
MANHNLLRQSSFERTPVDGLLAAQQLMCVSTSPHLATLNQWCCLTALEYKPLDLPL